MKRREILQTAFTSVLAILCTRAHAGESNDAPSALPQNTDPTAAVPVLTPENLYAMPSPFWQHFQGKLYIGKAGSDPTRQENWINVWVRTRTGEIHQLQQPVGLSDVTVGQFLRDDAALLTSAAHSMAVVDNNGSVLFNIADVTKPGAAQFSMRLTQPTGYQLVGEITSMENLRHTRPLFEGAKIKLRGWHEGSETGGGEFTGSLTPGIDDGGVTVSSGADFHWRRVINDFNLLTLFDFGAIADGKTDAADAIRAMYAWSLNTDSAICIQFPAGLFFVSGVDLSAQSAHFFRLAGATVNFGYFPATTLMSDGRQPFIFRVNARRVEISNLRINGRTGSQPNSQGFFDNQCQAGQFFRGSCLHFIQMGGTSLSLMDTLDCKIDQWYASRCQGDVIKSVWSGNRHGAWDHSTAIELANFNVQHCLRGLVLNLERCTQSLIHNGWIEHSENPGDISNGQWIIDALSLEACQNPLIAHYARLNMRQTNLQSGSWIDNSRAGEEWLGAWERGSAQVESYGIAVDGNLKYNYLNSRFRLVNNTSQSQWFELGTIWTPDVADSWQIEIFGQSGFSNNTMEGSLQKVVGGAITSGKAIISLQRKVSKFEGSWYVQGSSPISDVIINTPYDTDCRVYIQLAGWTGAAGILMTTNARDRFMTSRCARFDATMQNKNPPNDKNSARLPQRFTLHNNHAGIGANEQGDLLMDSRQISDSKVNSQRPVGWLSVMINGEPCAIPYFSLKS